MEVNLVQLTESRVQRKPDKTQEVDEACFSLDDQSLDQDETSVIGNRACSSESNNVDSAEVLYSLGLVGRGFGSPPVAESSPSSEKVLPDFDRLLSQNHETEDSGQELRKICQQMVQNGYKPEDISALMMMAGVNGELYDLSEELPAETVDCDGLGDESSWTEDDGTDIVETIRMGAQCCNDCCDILQCRMGQQMISFVEVDLENDHAMASLTVRRLLSTIIKHSAICDDSSCSIPWCSFFTQCREHGLEEQIALLQRHYRKLHLAEDLGEIGVFDSAEFILLDSSASWACVEHQRLHEVTNTRNVPSMLRFPRNGIDFLVYGHFGKYGQFGLTAISTTLPPIHLNIIQFMAVEESRSLWESLRDLQHNNIVRLLWTCVDGNNVTLCRDQQSMAGESLEHLVNMGISSGWRIHTEDAFRFISGLVEAIMFLNQKDIFYLRWIASGIQLSYDYTLAKLSDFSSAVLMSTLQDDDELVDVVVNSLPPHILPPEIFGDDDISGKIDSCTEVWGIGCIIYHVSCEKPIHHNSRHENKDDFQQTVKNFAPKAHLKAIKDRRVSAVLSRIFVKEKDRVTLQQLARLLTLPAPD